MNCISNTKIILIGRKNKSLINFHTAFNFNSFPSKNSIGLFENFQGKLENRREEAAKEELRNKSGDGSRESPVKLGDLFSPLGMVSTRSHHHILPPPELPNFESAR